MNGPRLPAGGVAQAVYTWSRKLVDGKIGMGFSAISPSLEGSIDWLCGLDPAEFNLFQGDVTGASSELYEARKGFSEVGRMIVDDVAIVYCKTADGAVSQAAARPHPVVHALVAECSTLGFAHMLHIRENFWTRKVEESGGDLGLPDLAMADFLEGQGPSSMHSCTDGHEGAREILRLVAEQGFGHVSTIELPSNGGAAAQVAVAFPMDIANGFSLIPWVSTDGVRRELVLRVPVGSPSGIAQQISGAAQRTAASPGECPFERAVQRAAERFLYGASPNLSQYAKAVLKPDTMNAPSHRALATTPRLVEMPEAEANPVYALLAEVRKDTGPLTEAASKSLIGILATGGIRAGQILELPHGTLNEIFASVQSAEVVWEWSRRVFADVAADTFIELWNKTHVGAFLGIVLMKNLAAPDGTRLRISADRGAYPRVTATILRSMRRYQGGGRSIGRIIKRGFGDSETMRIFIAETFQKDPKFLFDAILADAEIPPAHMVDYIRSCYQPWANYRRLPDRESAAIYQALRLTLIQRLKVLIGRNP